MATDGGSDVSVGGICACKAETEVVAEVDTVCTGSDSDAELRIAHRAIAAAGLILASRFRA